MRVGLLTTWGYEALTLLAMIANLAVQSSARSLVFFLFRIGLV